MIQSSGEASNISDDTATDDEDWLVSGNTVVLHVEKDVLNILHVLVDLITWMDQLGKWDLIVIEVFLQFFTEECLNLVIDESNASSERLVNFIENFVLWLKDASGDLDRCRDLSAHDSLNGLRVFGGQGQTIANSVDAGWVHSVWVDLHKSFVIGEVPLGIVKGLELHVVFDSDVSKCFFFEQLVNLFLHSFDGFFQVDVCQVFHQNSVVSKRKIGEILKLLDNSEQHKVVAESIGKIY